jgi:hypothetical protein
MSTPEPPPGSSLVLYQTEDGFVVMFLDYAKDEARRRQQVFLHEWQVKLDEFLRFNERAVLPDAGRVSREDADRNS